MDMLYRSIFGAPYDENKIGVGIVKDIFLARSTDTEIIKKGQDGGVVTTLLWTAMEEGIIDSAVESKMSHDKSPSGFLARNKEELLQGAGNSYEQSGSLEILSHVQRDTNEKYGVVGLPCQVLAVTKMKIYPTTTGIDMDNLRLIIGLFCGWSFSPGSFHDFLQKNFDLSKVAKFDIPHHPAHTFDVFTMEGKRSIELNEIRKYISPSCSYCFDMTAQFADVSVGSGRAKFKGWNTVIVRTEAGTALLERSKAKGIIETQQIPDENLTHLRRAALNKMKRAIESIIVRTGSKDDLGYLKIKLEILEKLHNGRMGL
jgi:coenzyme F420 hydrogenase subunit beta